MRWIANNINRTLILVQKYLICKKRIVIIGPIRIRNIDHS